MVGSVTILLIYQREFLLIAAQMYTRQGTLVAVLTQEGVVRRGLEVPKGDQAQAGKAKL